MPASLVPGPSIAAFMSQYDQYLLRVRGSAASTRQIHRLVVHQFLTCRFPDGVIAWSDLRFSDCAAFVRKEFARLPSHDTQRTWSVVLRSVLRYLVHDLFDACQKPTSRHLRDRALLLVLLRLGLHREEVANLTVRDIDWRNGLLHIRSTKTHQDRDLPLPEDVGHALVAHLRHQRPHPARVFEPRQPPFTAARSYENVGNTVRALLVRARIVDRGVHALRHTAATAMVNGGASFKNVADVLGHRSLATTLIYAKLDLRSLSQVALPWPGGGR